MEPLSDFQVRCERSLRLALGAVGEAVTSRELTTQDGGSVVLAVGNTPLRVTLRAESARLTGALRTTAFPEWQFSESESPDAIIELLVSDTLEQLSKIRSAT